MPMPRLLAAPGSADDWSHIFEGVRSAAALKRCYADFQAELLALDADFERHNAEAAARPWPNCYGLWTNLPRVLEVSVNL